jgi:hypothetical protein
MKTLGCFVGTAWGGIGKGNGECCAIYVAEKARADFNRQVRRPTGCVVLEELSSARLLEDAWRTAPSHSALLPA